MQDPTRSNIRMQKDIVRFFKPAAHISTDTCMLGEQAETLDAGGIVNVSMDSQPFALNSNPKGGEPLITLPPTMAAAIETCHHHGTRRIFACLTGGANRLRKGSGGSGCMVLGTADPIQAVAVATSLLRHPRLVVTSGGAIGTRPVQTVLVLCPAAHARVWASEWRARQPPGPASQIPLFVLDGSSPMAARIQFLAAWRRGGGVLVTPFAPFLELVAPVK